MDHRLACKKSKGEKRKAITKANRRFFGDKAPRVHTLGPRGNAIFQEAPLPVFLRFRRVPGRAFGGAYVEVSLGFSGLFFLALNSATIQMSSGMIT